MLTLAVAGLLAAPRTAAAPATAAEACGGSAFGDIVDIFSTCAECNFAGSDGRAQGFWKSYSCRGPIRGAYYLYVR